MEKETSKANRKRLSITRLYIDFEAFFYSLAVGTQQCKLCARAWVCVCVSECVCGPNTIFVANDRYYFNPSGGKERKKRYFAHL